jgi:hypothetical protein
MRYSISRESVTFITVMMFAHVSLFNLFMPILKCCRSNPSKRGANHHTSNITLILATLATYRIANDTTG